MVGYNDRDLDVEILRDINDLAARMPGWAQDAVAAAAQYIVPAALALVVGVAWFAVRRRPGAEGPAAVATVAWAGLAALIARIVNVPIRDFVARPRPDVGRPELDLTVLVDGRTGYSFVSDHASVAMAIAVALFLVHRKLGAVAAGLALLQGFAQLLMGVHYPTDVIGGYALGAAVSLLLAPLAMAALTPLVSLAAHARGLRWLVGTPAGRADGDQETGDGSGSAGGSGNEDHPLEQERGLAA